MMNRLHKINYMVGFFTSQRDILDALDPVAANYIRSQAEITHQSPVQIIGDLVRKELQSA